MRTNRSIKGNLSWWEVEYFLNDIEYTIIGGGIVGLSTAIELKNDNPQAKIIVLDKKKIPIGASTKNAGFACFGSISEIHHDFTAYGEDVCQKLIQMRWEGLLIMKSRIPENKMYYKPSPGAEIFIDNDAYEIHQNRIPWVNSFISSIVNDDHCFYSQNGAFGKEIINRLEGSLNPQMMMTELELIARSKGVCFLSGIEVDQINYSEKYLKTNLGNINYKKLIVCTNGFSRSLLPNLNIKPARNQVLVTNKIKDFKMNFCYHMNEGYIYFREYNGRLLIGGGRNMDEVEETTDVLGTTELIQSYLKDIVQKYILPNQTFSIEHSWSGILGVGASKMPIVELVDKDVLVAVRMGGMGLAIGSFIGSVAAGMILSNDNRALQLYVR